VEWSLNCYSDHLTLHISYYHWSSNKVQALFGYDRIDPRIRNFNLFIMNVECHFNWEGFPNILWQRRYNSLCRGHRCHIHRKLSYYNCDGVALLCHKFNLGSTHCFFQRLPQVRDQLIIMFEMFTIGSNHLHSLSSKDLSDPATSFMARSWVWISLSWITKRQCVIIQLLSPFRPGFSWFWCCFSA
jgi:hypothetical protein